MIKNIVLTHSYFYRLDHKQWKTAKPYPPLMTMGVSALLKANDYNVSIADSNLQESAEYISGYLKPETDILIIYDDGFNYLTKMCLTAMREACFTMIAIAKRDNIKVAVCSSDSTDHYEKYIEQGADYVLLGEGESSCTSLLESLNGKKSINEVGGIAYNDGTTVKKNPKGPVLTNLDSLPIPDWKSIDLSGYRSIWMTNHGYFSLNVSTTRGCPYKCNWCAKPLYGNRYNARSVGHVMSEIELLVKDFGATHIWFCDDIFGLKPGWVQEFDKQVKNLNLRFKYMIQSRADLLTKDNTIEALASSGADKIWIGDESGSQKILDAMDKGTTVGQIGEATDKLHNLNVQVAYFLQFGYLGETWSDIQQTLKMVKKNKPDEIGISVSYPLPGTGFYDKVKSQLITKQNWVDSDELAIMYKATYPKKFYKILHRFVHWYYQKNRRFKLAQIHKKVAYHLLSIIFLFRLKQFKPVE